MPYFYFRKVLKIPELWHRYCFYATCFEWGCICCFKHAHTAFSQFWCDIVKDGNRYRREPSTCKSCFMWKSRTYSWH